MPSNWIKVPLSSHEEWLDWRRGGIGSSDAAAIVGVSPYATPLQIWNEKVNNSQRKDNAAMAHGRQSEEASRLEFETLMNESYFKVDGLQSTTTDWLRASLDGLNLEGSNAVEIKKANKEDHAVARNGRVPEKYYPQCQHIINLLGIPGMYYYSSPADGSGGIVVEVARDSHFIENELMPKEELFWKMVLDKRPPELTERDFVHLDGNDLISEAIEAKRIIKAQEARYKKALDSLKEKVGEFSFCGNGVKWVRMHCDGAIDYKAAIDDYLENLRAHYPDIEFKPVPAEAYRKPSFVKYQPYGI